MRDYRIRFLGSGSFDQTRSQSGNTQLAHNYAALKPIDLTGYKALHRSCGDTVCGLRVPPVVPFDRSLCPAPPSLQWVAWASLPHLLDQTILSLTIGTMIH
ncbi:MAG: hypothetical protein WBC36_17805 [Desulfobacterales bacterium]